MTRFSFIFRGIKLIGVMILGALVLFSNAVASNNSSSDAFLGLWEGIDPEDGSTVQISINDFNKDGVLEIVAREGYFTVCYDGIANTQGRGTITGTGTLLSKTQLWVERTRICINDDNTKSDPVSFSVTYTLDSKRQVLDIGFTVLHRTSN